MMTDAPKDEQAEKQPEMTVVVIPDTDAEKYAIWSLGIAATSLVFSIFVFIILLVLAG